MKTRVTRVTRNTVITIDERGVPYGWLKRKWDCLYDAIFGSTVVIENGSPVEVTDEN